MYKNYQLVNKISRSWEFDFLNVIDPTPTPLPTDITTNILVDYKWV